MGDLGEVRTEGVERTPRGRTDPKASSSALSSNTRLGMAAIGASSPGNFFRSNCPCPSSVIRRSLPLTSVTAYEAAG